MNGCKALWKFKLLKKSCLPRNFNRDVLNTEENTGFELYHFCSQIDDANKTLIMHRTRLSAELGSEFSSGIQNPRRDLVFPRAVDSSLHEVTAGSSSSIPTAAELAP